MTAETSTYQLWINWDTHTASLEFVPDFEVVTFFSLESYQSNIKLLKQSGFCFL